jgi:hypothetical protein
MKFISRALYFFTPYTDARERAVGRFFKSLSEHGNRTRAQARLGTLLQHDIAAINLWTEYRYKGYRYLRKSQRRKLYANLQIITDDFDRFYASKPHQADMVIQHAHALAPHATVESERILLLQALMDYFSPVRGIYEYRATSSFGRLLRDPSHEKLVGDCNQIVTLYIYLYSRYFDVHDLKVRVLPEHVALHYGGVDIETTNGTLVNYSEKANSLLPVEEITSINLLDTSDSYLSTHEVAAEDFLQAARFAFILSHSRDIAKNNLDVAYSSLINSLMKRNNYGRALEFALASRDITLLSVVGSNGASYELQHNNYAAARRFAQHTPKRDELVKASWQAEGSHYYQAQRYHDANKAFKHINESTLVRQCYVALFFEEQEKLGSNLTTESIKKYSSTIRHMRAYAKKSGNKKLVEYADTLTKYL